jgi:hypothetical protein
MKNEPLPPEKVQKLCKKRKEEEKFWADIKKNEGKEV